MIKISGKPKSLVDTGLDSHTHNWYIAERRRIEGQKEMEKRKKNLMTYPSKNETLRDQKRMIPTQNTLDRA